MATSVINRLPQPNGGGGGGRQQDVAKQRRGCGVQQEKLSSYLYTVPEKAYRGAVPPTTHTTEGTLTSFLYPPRQERTSLVPSALGTVADEALLLSSTSVDRLVPTTPSPPQPPQHTTLLDHHSPPSSVNETNYIHHLRQTSHTSDPSSVDQEVGMASTTMPTTLPPHLRVMQKKALTPSGSDKCGLSPTDQGVGMAPETTPTALPPHLRVMQKPRSPPRTDDCGPSQIDQGVNTAPKTTPMALPPHLRVMQKKPLSPPCTDDSHNVGPSPVNREVKMASMTKPTALPPHLRVMQKKPLSPSYTDGSHNSSPSPADRGVDATPARMPAFVPPHLPWKKPISPPSTDSSHGPGPSSAEPEVNTTPEKTSTFVPPHPRWKKSIFTAYTEASTHDASPPPKKPAEILEKLSEVGVKVSDAMPVRRAVFDDPTTGELGRDPKQASGASPRSKQARAPHATEQGARLAGPVRQGLGRGGGRWLKNSEIPKPDPRRWEPTWSASGAGIDSLCADGGWGKSNGWDNGHSWSDANKKRDQANDWNASSLTDWQGGWAPAPLDWDSRPAFRDNQSVSLIESWLQKVDKGLRGLTLGVPMEDVTLSDGNILQFACESNDKGVLLLGDAAPRYWLPRAIGKQAPQAFWREIVASNAPKPVDEDDLKGVKPWWDLYQTKESAFLQPVVQPSVKGVDPDETTDERLARENDNGSDRHTQNRKRTETAKRELQRERKNKPKMLARKFEHLSPFDRKDIIKPQVKLYVRSARPADMVEIRDIYNHYIEFTTSAPETQPHITEDMHHLHGDVKNNKLPFLVACERGRKITSRKLRENCEEVILPDRVIGFAFANDYNDLRGMYRFTVEAEVYTHKEYNMKGVATCLMDKLVSLLDPHYEERGGFEVQGQDLEGARVGASRILQNIVINLPYAQPERLEWASRWLCGWLGFEQVGDMKNIGIKNSKKYVFNRCGSSPARANIFLTVSTSPSSSARPWSRLTQPILRSRWTKPDDRPRPHYSDMGSLL